MTKPTDDELDYRQLYDHTFLCAGDFAGKGDVLVTIESVQPKFQAPGAGDGKRKALIKLKGVERGWICGPANCQALAALLGTRPLKDWPGKQVYLACGRVKNPKGPGQVDGIVVKPYLPQAEKGGK